MMITIVVYFNYVIGSLTPNSVCIMLRICMPCDASEPIYKLVCYYYATRITQNRRRNFPISSFNLNRNWKKMK